MASNTIVNGTANSLSIFDNLPDNLRPDMIKVYVHPEGKKYVMIGLLDSTGLFYILRVYGGKWGNKFKLDQYDTLNEYSASVREADTIRNSHGYTSVAIGHANLHDDIERLFSKFRTFFQMASNVYVGDVFDQIDEACVAIINKGLMDLTLSGADMRTMNFAMNYMKGLAD